MSKFKQLVRKLEGKGKSADQAAGIAAKVGREKYGKSGMEAKAAAGRKKKCKPWDPQALRSMGGEND